MNIFNNTNFLKKIAITVLTVILLQVVVVKPVHADALQGGGKLLKPVFSLVMTIGDGLVHVMHSTILGIKSGDLIHIKTQLSTGEMILIGIQLISNPIALLTFEIPLLYDAIKNIIEGHPGESMMYKGAVAIAYAKEQMPTDLYLPNYSYTPEEIFKGNILLFDVNFFRDPKKVYAKTKDGTKLTVSDYKNGDGEPNYDKLEEDINNHKGLEYYYYNKDGKEVITTRQDSAYVLQGIISNWYKALRNICLVLMLSILVYIGIRMLLASVASDRAKYLTMIKDWTVGICLLFLMHYIMAFSVTIVEKLTDVVSASINEKSYVVYLPKVYGLEAAFKEYGWDEKYSTKDGQYYGWPCDLMGYLRLNAQMDTKDNAWQYIGEAVMFFMLVIFTIMFTFTYFKRLLYMAFLTMISPMVALTYCIDKLNDGQAQGFNAWLKEYIFNLLIQPMHLLLYYILVTSSFSLMGTNVVFSIVALAFMLPAEKMLRSFFGFEKAKSSPKLGPAGAMAAGSALTSLLNKGRATLGSGRGGKSSGEGSEKVAGRPIVDRANFESQLEDENMIGDGSDNNELRQTNNPDLEENDSSNSSNNSNRLTLASDSEDTDKQNEAIKKAEELRQKELEERLEKAKKEEQPQNQSEPRKFTGELGTRVKNMPRQFRRSAIGLGAYAGSKARRTLKNAPRTAIRMAGKGLGKAATGIPTAALTGGIGLAVGAATGDFSNAAKGALGAGAAGFSLTSGIPQAIAKDIKNDPAFDAAYNKGKFKDDAINDYVKEFRRSKDYEKVRATLKSSSYSDAEVNEMLKAGGEVDEYVRNGITDSKAIKAMHDMKMDKNVETVKTTENAIDSYKMLQNMGDLSSAKKQDEGKATIRRIAKKGGVRDNMLDKFANDRMNEMLYLKGKLK